MQRPFARWTRFTTRTAPLLALAALSACNSQDSTPAPAAEASAPVAAATRTLAPPVREDFAAAWERACPDAEPVNKALCKSKGLTDPNFECDFGLGEDEYRRHTTDLARGEDAWEIADAEQACAIGAAEG